MRLFIVNQYCNKSYPCRCRSGFYCLRHLSYGLSDRYIGPKILKTGKRRKVTKTEEHT